MSNIFGRFGGLWLLLNATGITCMHSNILSFLTFFYVFKSNLADVNQAWQKQPRFMITLLHFLRFPCLPSLILCNHCASICLFLFFSSLHFNSCPYSCSLSCEESQKSSKLLPISSIKFKSQGCHVGVLLTFIDLLMGVCANQPADKDVLYQSL